MMYLKNRRCAALALALAALMLIAAVPRYLPAAAEEGVFFTVDDLSGVHGEQATVRVMLSCDAGDAVNGLQFRVLFDPLLLRADSAEVCLAGNYKGAHIGEGVVDFFWTDLEPLTSGGCAAQIVFTLQKAGTGSVAVVLDAGKGDSVYTIDKNAPGGAVDIDCAFLEKEGTTTVLARGAVTAELSPGLDLCFTAESVEVPVNAAQAAVGISMTHLTEALYGYSVQINYDPEKLRFREGSFPGKFPYGRAVSHEPGKVLVFAATEAGSPATGDERMATVCFDLIDPDRKPGDRYALTISFYNGQPTYTLDNEKKTVEIDAVCTVPGSVSLVWSTLPYDVDGSGRINISDVTALLNVLAGGVSPETAHYKTDIDGNHEVNISDVTALLNYLAVGA